MNVGIYFSENPPEEGGGYTFENEILESLLALAELSNHDFVIFSKVSIEKKIPKNISYRVKNVTLPKYAIFERICLFVIHNFFPDAPLLRTAYLKFSNLEKLIKKYKIESMLFCNPLHEPTDIPYITIVWDLQHRLQPWFPEVSEKGQWYSREEYYVPILKRATYIITGTNAGKQEIALFYGIPNNRIKILPHPTPNFALNVEKSDNDVLKKYQIQNEYLIYPAQFWPHKNHANILLSIKILKETYRIPLSIVFVGADKINLKYIQKMSSDLLLSEDVHFLGFVPRKDLVDLYQNAFALLYPTFFGPENLPPLEAFALKCPVIASNVSGAGEQLGDAALLVDPKNPEEMAKAIVSLYNDPILRNQLIEKGHARATRWIGEDFIKGVFLLLDELATIRRCWE
jgi:glycosyltransferase involved in cell wall biosynthesis